MIKKSNKIIPHICGIDALYYFAQSGGGYDNYYLDIINQIEDKKASFIHHDYAYDESDIIITVNNIDIKYSGMGRDGFIWLNHDFFRVGFKDSQKAQNIHNIRVQLNAIGIYTLGITSLVEYINTKLLDGALLNERYFPVTRIDLNMFIQHNFNYLTKDMILSKKKTHNANISERTSGYELETYYVGKKPFMLRIYNKLHELENASDIKREIMFNYFGIHNLDVQKSIFNVEFEFHREFLKQYGIDTIEDALSRSNMLFKLGCELVKVLDVSNLTKEQINSSNRKRAPLNPVWEYITSHYDNKEFMQLETPLEKIERISYRYSLEDARRPIKRQITRLLLHDSKPTLLYFYELLQSAQKEYELKQSFKKVHDEYKKSDKNNNDDKNEAQIKIESLKNDLKHYSDIGLLEFEKRLSKEMFALAPTDTRYDELLHIYNMVSDELVKRGLVKMPF